MTTKKWHRAHARRKTHPPTGQMTKKTLRPLLSPCAPLFLSGDTAHTHMHRTNIYPSKQPPLHVPREILICQSSHELDHLQLPHQPLIQRLRFKQLARRQPACVERLAVSICSLVLELQLIAVLQVSNLNRSLARYRATA
jgi:hypothetical protein